MDPKHQNDEDGRCILVSNERKPTPVPLRNFHETFVSFYQNIKPFSLQQSFYLTFKGTFTEDLLIETFY